MERDVLRVGNVDHVYCNIEELGEAIGQIVQDFSSETRVKVKQATREVTEETRDTVKERANVDPRNVARKGKYKRSISFKMEERPMQDVGIIYARGHEYSLTHLLENGHELWNSPKRTRAFPHWVTGERYAIKELPERIVKKLKG